MHYTDTSEIKSEIGKLVHTVVNIFNIKQNLTHIPLPLLFVDLKRKQQRQLPNRDLKLHKSGIRTFKAKEKHTAM